MNIDKAIGYLEKVKNEFPTKKHPILYANHCEYLELAISALQAQAERRWIPVTERLPKPEVRVLICAESHVTGKTYKHIAAAMYEDGTVWREESTWNFNDLDNYDTYDEEQDDWKIPEGWWEYTIYNGEEGNYPVDDFVTHWMPLPEPPKEENE